MSILGELNIFIWRRFSNSGCLTGLFIGLIIVLFIGRSID